MKKWRILCGLLFCILLIGITNAASAIGGTVTFADASLEAAVRDTLINPAGDITVEEMMELTELDASGRGIKDLSGIEYAIHLKALNLSDNEIRDVTKIGSLSKLETLILNGNQIVSIDELGHLGLLKSLWLMNNQITGLGAISSLQQLEHLYLVNNQIGSLAGLETLHQLKDLNLARNQITDIASLKALTRLQSLSLEENHIASISGMESLSQLQWLSLAYNPVTDLTALGGLTELNYVNQRGFAIAAASNQVLKQLENRGAVVEYALVIPDGNYLYDVNQDGVSNTNDINDMINFYLHVNDMKNRHPEMKITGNEIDPALINGAAYIYDLNRDGVADTNDINDAINFYLNLKDMKNKHPEFKVIVR